MTTAGTLDWPAGYERTPHHRRVDGQLAKDMSPGRILDDLENEVRLLGGRDLIISTLMRLRPDGRPYASQSRPEDPGAAVYFDWKGTQHAMACDLFLSVWKNLRAITLCIESLRRLERLGGGALLERAFHGFQALPASIIPAPPWWSILGWDAEPDAVHADEVREAYRARAIECHPDKGGTQEQMTQLNMAKTEALERVS